MDKTVSMHIMDYIYTYINRVIFLNTISTNPKIEFALPMPNSEIMFWKRTLHKYTHIYTIVHM